MSLLLRKLASLVLVMMIGGLLAATLVRFSPGWDVDEREMDLRRSEQSIQALQAETAGQRSVPRFYLAYLRGLATGDLGISRATHRPVAEILAERLPQTVRTVGWGCALAWLFGLSAAVVAVSRRSMMWDMLTVTTSGLLLSLPAAVIGLIALWTGIGVEWAVCAVVAPKVFRYSLELFRNTYAQPHVLTAAAKGLSTARILLAHIVRPSLNELLAIGGTSIALAFGAAIPLESVCDVPGLGQLAWQSASARDLPVLVSLTLGVTLVVKAAGMLADVSRGVLGEAS